MHFCQRKKTLPLLLLVAMVGCTTDQQQENETPVHRSAKPLVIAANYPLAYFAERIAGDAATVELPMPAGIDPAFWQPREADIRRLQDAELILLNGAGYEKWLEKVSLPPSKLVDTSVAFAENLIAEQDGVVHSHGPSGPHSHAGVAFTTWLDPQQAGQQAAAVGEALKRLLPEHREALEKKLTALQADLKQLDADLTAVIANYSGQPLFASHPVYQYLARRCQWKLQSRHWEPEEMPANAEWEDLKTQLAEHPAAWMIWEAPPAAEIAARLETLGVKSAVYSPCFNRPESGDFLSVMRQNVENLKPVFAASNP